MLLKKSRIIFFNSYGRTNKWFFLFLFQKQEFCYQRATITILTLSRTDKAVINENWVSFFKPSEPCSSSLIFLFLQTRQNKTKRFNFIIVVLCFENNLLLQRSGSFLQDQAYWTGKQVFFLSTPAFIEYNNNSLYVLVASTCL